MAPCDRHRCIAQRFTLGGDEFWAHFEKMHGGCFAEPRNNAGRAQCVPHHGAAPGSILDQLNSPWCAEHLLPDNAGPQTDDLAEGLADFGSGNEIAGPADDTPCCVVSVRFVPQAA